MCVWLSKGWSHRSAVTMVTGLSGPQGRKREEVVEEGEKAGETEGIRNGGGTRLYLLISGVGNLGLVEPKWGGVTSDELVVPHILQYAKTRT